MKKADRYIHDFPSCSRTYATLCIYHKSADPDIITDMLNINPDRSHKVGDTLYKNKKASSSGWFLGTKDVVDSRDVTAHIDWILDKLCNKVKVIRTLSNKGYIMRIACFWGSVSGNGGPYIDHELSCRLSKYPLDLDFDIWFEIPEMPKPHEE